jgi:hypothetical protein
LGKRVGQRQGWPRGTFIIYGTETAKQYKKLVAMWWPAVGAIRFVVMDELAGWAAYCCADPSADVSDILGCVADRFSLERAFRDSKEMVGAGQQQVRFEGASLGAFHI